MTARSGHGYGDREGGFDSVASPEDRLKDERELPENAERRGVVTDVLKAHLKPNPAWREWVDRHGK